MRAHELIFNEEGRIIGSNEIDINSITKVENGWMSGGNYIPSSKVLISLGDRNNYSDIDDNTNFGHII